MKLAPFATITGAAVSMPEENIDTDIIFPARFLLLTQREGLGVHAFHDRRYLADGTQNPGFVLNQPPFRTAPILVAGANFGSGSSREQAVWALVGHGIRAVIAPSLGEIFAGNCLRNGVLAITLDPATIAALHERAASGQIFTVSLETQSITAGNQPPTAFAIAPERRQALLMGWDETDQVLARFGEDITRFEAAQRRTQPWLHEKDPTR